MLDWISSEVPIWVVFLGGMATTLLGLFTYLITRSDSKLTETFQSRELLRGRYAELSFEIMKLVGRLTTPKTRREFIDDAYRLDQLYDGEALLLPEPTEKYPIKLAASDAKYHTRHWDGDDGSIYFALGVIVYALGDAWSVMTNDEESDLDEVDGVDHTAQRSSILSKANAELSKRMRYMLHEQFNINSGSSGTKAPNVKNE